MILIIVYSCNADKTDNLKTFANAYGYIKYFHPSDEAYTLNWEKFSAYGAKEMRKCNSRPELLSTLNSLFNPIAPGVKFILSEDNSAYDLKTIIPPDTSGFRITYWQHMGINFDVAIPDKRVNAYHSTRVHRTAADTALFPGKPVFGEILKREIGQGITCFIPVCLYCNDKSTYPSSDSGQIKQLRLNLSSFDFNTEEMPMRFGNVIYVYNIMRHFYPYFDVVKADWDDELTKALAQTFKDKTSYDHLRTLQRLTAALKDGHASVNYLKTSEYFSIPVTWEWIEGKLVITHDYDNNPDISIGDIVTKINGEDPEEYFNKIYPLISAPTKGWLDYRSNIMSLLGEKDSKVTLLINNKTIELTRSNRYYDYTVKNKETKPVYRFTGDICYLDMDRIEMDTINKIMPRLERSKSIICDARGYPKSNHDLLRHFMKTDDTTSAWMQIPQIMYPDYEKVTFARHNWTSFMKAQKPYLGDKKLIYIIDGSAISYAESCLGYVEGYKLATIIGQPSAGTNGNVNPFRLPGDYMVAWTGMKVVKHNGSQHHNVGIKPDIYVNKTIQGVKEGRDEFLEKAFEIARK
jgi:C-terminal processing protease CtpA/Prc